MLIQITILCAAFAAALTVLIKYVLPDIARTYKDVFLDELEAAKMDVAMAEQDFNYAETGYVDAAIYRLKAAEEKLNALIRDKKGYRNVRRMGKAV